MCIQTRIQQKIQQKAELDAQIAKLEKLENATAPVKNLLAELLANYAQEAPEDLTDIWEEVLAIGQQHNLPAQPLVVDELRSQLAQVRATDHNPSPESKLIEEEEFTIVLPQPLSDVKCEPENLNSIDSILKARGFFQPEDLEIYDKKYETYRGWDIYYSFPNSGIVSIGLYDIQRNQPWDVDTECVQEIDPTFPESLADYDEIVAWTRALIDQVEGLEVPGQLSLEFPDPTSEQIEEELGCNWDDEESESTPGPTKLQELLVGNSNFTFEELGVSVVIESVIAPTDDIVDFESEEARITVTNSTGKTLEYFVDAQTFVYQQRPDSVERAALGYAQYFLRELEKEAGIKEKINQWKTDDVQQIESVDPEIEEIETDGRFTTMGFKVQVYPQPPMGATFRFLNADNVVVFANSLTTAEIADRTWKVCAWDLISSYRDKEKTRLEKLANPYAKEEAKFIELIKLTPAVGYLKRRDNGELIAAYAAFSNRDTTGKKASTFAKVRAKKWATHLHGSFESCGWKVEEPRKIARMEAEPGAKQQFAYEIKITGNFSIGQLQKLAEEDFSLLPNEIAVTETTANVPPAPASTQVYRVKVNSYELATGTEEEMRSRFEEELKILGGSQMSASLLIGSEVIESHRVNDFEFTQIEGFDTENPEYEVVHLPSNNPFRVYKRLIASPEFTGWTNTVYPYTPGFAKREAAAADAVRRLLKAGQAE